MIEKNDRRFAGVTEEDLHAYVDGELAPERRLAVESYLSCSPEDARQVSGYQAQRIQLKGLYGRFEAESLPPELESLALEIAAESRGRRRYRLSTRRVGIAAILLVSIGAGGGWLAREVFEGQPEDPLFRFTESATRAYEAVAHRSIPPVERKPSTANPLDEWFERGGPDEPIEPPDISNEGFHFVWSSVIPNTDSPKVQLVYEHSNTHSRLALTIGRTVGSEQSLAFTFVQEQALSAFYWRDDRIQYSLIGDLPRERLLEVAESINEHLRPTPPAKGAPTKAPPVESSQPKPTAADPLKKGPPDATAAPRSASST